MQNLGIKQWAKPKKNMFFIYLTMRFPISNIFEVQDLCWMQTFFWSAFHKYSKTTFAIRQYHLLRLRSAKFLTKLYKLYTILILIYCCNLSKLFKNFLESLFDATSSNLNYYDKFKQFSLNILKRRRTGY